MKWSIASSRPGNRIPWWVFVLVPALVAVIPLAMGAYAWLDHGRAESTFISAISNSSPPGTSFEEVATDYIRDLGGKEGHLISDFRYEVVAVEGERTWSSELSCLER